MHLMHDSVRNTFQDPTLIWSILKTRQYVHVLRNLINDGPTSRSESETYVY